MFPIASLGKEPFSGSSALFPWLRLHVRGADGAVRPMEFSNVSEKAALEKAASMGLLVVSIEAPPLSRSEKINGGSSRFPLLQFTQELLALLDAGLNLIEALTALHAKERQASVRSILGVCLQALHQGHNFSEVLAAQPDYFPEIYVATVRASERSGDLAKALARYCVYELQFEALRKKLVSAAIYPSVLLAVGVLVVTFLMGYVVPRFSAVYESSGRELPWASALLLGVGQWVHGNQILCLVIGLPTVLGLACGISSDRGRRWILQKALGLPWLSAKTNEFRLARFYRAVSLLLASGIALSRALGMTANLLDMGQRDRLLTARRMVEHGSSLGLALVTAGLATPVAESLIRVGERSGQMADMLERAARFQDDDLARWVDVASRLLEPVLMVFIGLVIGAVVVLMYLPIFELAGGLQ